MAAEYAAKYGTRLMHDLKGELHGDLEEVILALMLSPAVYDSRHLHKAICVSSIYRRERWNNFCPVELLWVSIVLERLA